MIQTVKVTTCVVAIWRARSTFALGVFAGITASRQQVRRWLIASPAVCSATLVLFADCCPRQHGRHRRRRAARSDGRVDQAPAYRARLVVRLVLNHRPMHRRWSVERGVELADSASERVLLSRLGKRSNARLDLDYNLLPITITYYLVVSTRRRLVPRFSQKTGGSRLAEHLRRGHQPRVSPPRRNPRHSTPRPRPAGPTSVQPPKQPKTRLGRFSNPGHHWAGRGPNRPLSRP